MDLVVNHSSDEHRWFLESKRSKIIHTVIIISGGIRKTAKSQQTGEHVLVVPHGSLMRQPGHVLSALFLQKQPDLNWDEPGST